MSSLVSPIVAVLELLEEEVGDAVAVSASSVLEATELVTVVALEPATAL